MTLNAANCWTAVLHRDASSNGTFFFGVLTTGVFCKPSCPSRRPLRENVRFYPTAVDAERDGLRPCLRCRPLQSGDPSAARMHELCHYLREHCEESLSLSDIAHHIGLSPSHLLRTFKAAIGVTPKQYLDTCRLERFKSHLLDGKPVTDAIYSAGYNSSSRLYERAPSSLGMTPTQFRRNGSHTEIAYTVAASPVGLMLVAATSRGLCAVEFGDSGELLKQALVRRYPAATLLPDAKPLVAWVEALRAHLNGAAPATQLPLDIRISAFQARVYDALREIPYGETRSYGAVAASIGSPNAARAVARACAANPVAITVPCHRVVTSEGGPGGYRWGADRKRAILQAEAKPLS